MKKQNWEKELKRILRKIGGKSWFLVRWKDERKILEDFIRQLLVQQKEEIKNLIAEEMLICHKENQPTSRLTSLANKI